MEKIVGVGCRFRLALFLRLKLYTFWKKLETRRLKPNPPRVKISGFKPGSGTRGNLQGIFLLNQATFLRFALF